MSTMHTESDVRLEEAAAWWAKFQDAEPAQGDVAAWLAWLEADTRNAASFKEVNELAERVRHTQITMPQRLVPLQPPSSYSLLRFRRYALAAALLLALGALAAFFPRSPADTYATAAAAQREISLPDGSRVTLGGASELEAVFSPRQRLIRLAAGEAYFEVKHDAAHRPFIVDAGIATVQALGTAFNVRKNEQHLAVTVTDGRVRVAKVTNSRQTRAIEVGRAQQVVVDPEVVQLNTAAADPRRATAWRQGRLEFVDEPLDIVIANVSRYSETALLAVDPALHQITYTGTFVPGQLESWLGALEKVFQLEVRRQGDALAVLRHDTR